MYHMAILLLFNQSSSWTVKQLEEETKIETNLLLKLLGTLLERKFLTCEQFKNKKFINVDDKMNCIIALAYNFKR